VVDRSIVALPISIVLAVTIEVGPLDPNLDQLVVAELHMAVALPVTRSDDWDLPSRFSSWTRLVRVIAYLRRFIPRLKLKKQTLPDLSSTLSSDEIRNAELFWLRHI